MQNIDSRLESFKAITKPKSKVKPAFPLKASTHPNLTPDALSKAGFYHTPGPSTESYDNCKCFLCNVELGGWDEDDDPFKEHARRGNCAWAEMVCTVKIEKRKRDQSDGSYTTTYTTQESLPQSVDSAFVREQTFKKWWPHKQKAGWLPTVKNLARAGFVYSPSVTSKDAVMCPYCEYGVEGWEATDDPWQIHQAKVPDCHFFRAQLEGGGPSEQKVVKAPSRGKKSELPKRSTRANTVALSVVSDAEEEAHQSAELPLEVEDSIIVSQSTTKSRSTKPRATTSRRKTTARGKKKEDAAEPEPESESAVEPDVIEIADDTIRSISQSQVPQEEEPVIGAKDIKGKAKKATKAKPRATTAKGKGKKKAEEVYTADEVIPVESEVEVGSGTENEGQMDCDVEVESEPVRNPPSKLSSKTASSQSKSSKSSKSSSSKPLPPLPPPASPTPSARPLSQLDRFANIPPSSPIPTPRSKSTLRSTQPTKPSPHSNLPREVFETSLMRGAIEARKVIEDLISSPVAHTPGNGQAQTTVKNGNRVEDRNSIVKLTEEQKKMTLEDLVRFEMKKRFQEMQKEGEEMIAKWEEKTQGERKRIEAI
ncbi:uncharacterized protein IL334_001638 [Kwoniella shivajii]|uniref:BIR-domain-containing protein n=1 Tax=Kwoniella shivajii TaxID=564305 RepID=A0ABZ1CSG7_9TREE|nr:hypothetical protein IL334_001638 [Kwoniella shivajii]